MGCDPEAVRALERAGWNRAAATYEATFAHASRPFADPLLDAARHRAASAIDVPIAAWASSGIKA